MRKDMRLVEMEYVDDGGIGERLEKNQIVIIVPARAGGDDAVCGRASPNGRGELGLHSVPAVGVAHLRLVENFEEDAIRVPRSITLRHCIPEIGEAFDAVVL